MKNVITYFLLIVLTVAFATYFYYADMLWKKGSQGKQCSGIDVVILDSLESRFVSENEVKGLINNSDIKPIGQETATIKLSDIEELLNNRSAVKKSEVSLTRDGVLHVSITQRSPVLRIQTAEGGYYIDESGFIFPLLRTYTSHVPVVTGCVPVDDRKWIKSLLEFGEYISGNEFWGAQIQQIYVEPNGDIKLYTRLSDQSVTFGAPDRIAYKFQKLNAFYQSIVPLTGWNKYSDVNLKYSDQIICTPRKEKGNNKTI